ncbi:hypothetical protein NIE88_05975 [Sporolactobacillus shoreicorticis]|uniref:Uncharacterized protein n=1 Tax=Sporolactobacillus shoreicorticis TaxID=1923877 RepID=A0ABW5S326_9BACL|nr:hypothetical protein [Sporolactobacillus shoreicorticis]MCO7125312.1 hypothetical protein [Sporolactobacillus shoreicorticis]
MMRDSELLYYGTGQKYLDIFSLHYRWFSAEWTVEEEKLVILNYAFADDEKTAREKVGGGGESVRRDDAHLKEIYASIRNRQSDEDWNKRSKIHTFRVWESPWKKMKPGWYIVRSRKHFPFYISAVHVRLLSTWLVHTAVCENQKEVVAFIHRVNQTHHIKLVDSL